MNAPSLHFAILAGVFFAGSFATVAASAAPLTASEPADLSNDMFNPTPLGELGAGLNTVTGSLIDADRDWALVELPAGLQVDVAEIEITNHSDSRDGETTLSFAVLLESDLDVQLLNGGVFGNVLSTANGPFTESGTYIVRIIHSGFLQGSSSDYQFRFSVSPIPEPNSLVLLGLGGLVGLRPQRDKRRLHA